MGTTKPFRDQKELQQFLKAQKKDFDLKDWAEDNRIYLCMENRLLMYDELLTLLESSEA